MTNAYDRDENGENSMHAPGLVPTDSELPGTEEPATVDASEASGAQARPRPRRRAPKAAPDEDDDAGWSSMESPEGDENLPTETRGRADAIIVPILGTVVGLMALGALGLILVSQKRSQTRSAALLAALSAASAHWAEGARHAEHGVASDLSGRVNRIRRRYGI
jgi:hypothetical protein